MVLPHDLHFYPGAAGWGYPGSRQPPDFVYPRHPRPAWGLWSGDVLTEEIERVAMGPRTLAMAIDLSGQGPSQ